jgi:hypothetical protein
MLTVENCLFWSEFSVLAAGVAVDDVVVAGDSEDVDAFFFIEELLMFSDRNNKEIEKLINVLILELNYFWC